ncbi:MAG: VacJ family lipoprotein [Desulfobacteraceae bacterium]|nr:MAG: VacJ family lipoprotein [Desulfobacteraceae bacterium]
MKSRPLAVVLSIVAAFCLFYGCAAARPAGPENTSVAAPSAPVEETRPAEIAPESPGGLTEEELLLEDELGWENQQNEHFYSVADPLEKFNRAMFVLNDKLYFWLMKPVAQGYRAVVPRVARSAVMNFFLNAGAPIRIVNNILQGKGRNAEAEWARFLYNSTVGVLGFGNPAAAHPGLAPREEDLGQTLAVYGIGDGFFIFWPLLGPSTLRDTVGMAGDRFLSPLGYVEPLELSLGISSYNVINNLSFHIGDYESLKDAALDPYASFRNAYIQSRQTKIKR